jgi:glycosyltransferase involved in cell wall biosynthesis
VPTDISIIIPLFNKEDFIVQTLKSILNQDNKDWECIIVDDGSTDNSLQIVTDFCNANAGNWKILSVANGGQTKARNIGIREATGRYLAFLDADDLWVTDKLSKQFQYLEGNPEVMAVLSSYAIFGASSGRIRVVRIANFDRMLRNWADMSGFGGGLESVGMVRRIEGLSGLFFDESLSTSSGLDFMIRCAQLGNVILLKEIGLLYRLSGGQWHTNIVELSNNAAKIAENYSSYFKSNLHKRHLEYYFWVEARKHGHAHLLLMILSDLVHLRSSRLQMLLRLFLRNIKALWVGSLNRKYVLKQLQILSS